MSVITSFDQVMRPRFFLEANGGLATDLIPFITQVSYEEAENKQDELQIVVANPALRFRDDPRFLEGARFRFRFGYIGDLSETKNVVIAKARPSYPQSGVPTITMVAWGLQKDMNKKSNPFNWGTVASSDVAKAVAKRYGFLLEVEESLDARRQHRIQPAGITDFQYLMQLANKLNWDFFIEGTTLHFHRKKYDAPAQHEYVYYTDSLGTLVSFDPDVNLNKASKSGVAGADNKKGDSHSAGGSEGTRSQPLRYGSTSTGRLIDTDNNKDSALVPGVPGPHAYNGEGGKLSPTHESDSKVVKIHGAAKAAKIDMNAIKARVEVIGSPRLKCRQVIRIIGVDKIYSGNWRISKVKHAIDGRGYKTTCEVKRDAAKAASKSQNKHEGVGSDGKSGLSVAPRVRYAIGQTSDGKLIYSE